MKFSNSIPGRFWHGLLQKARQRGTAYTSLDAMKLLAIVNMTADHIGAYLFPDMLWWRVIGRVTIPVWFFLVGYSLSPKWKNEIWLYAGLLIAAQPFMGYPVFPLNVLVSILLCRLILELCEDRGLLPKRLPELTAAFVMLSLFTVTIFEYGSVAVLFALMGRMVRKAETKHFTMLVFWSYLTFVGWQLAFSKYDMLQTIYIALGTAWVIGWLARCPNKVVWQDWTSSRTKTFIAILSRNTLPYYFYHRLIIQLLAALLLGHGIEFLLRLF